MHVHIYNYFISPMHLRRHYRISACRWDRNEIPTATPVFSGSINSMEVLWMLSDQTRSRKFNHQAAISDFRLLVYVAQHSDYFHWVARPRKYGCSIWNFVPIPSTSWDLSTSGLDAAILDFRLPVLSDSIQATCIDLPDPKNMGLAFGISFLSHLQAEI